MTEMWKTLLSSLVYSRIVEMHLAISSPSSPYPNKRAWYAAVEEVYESTKKSLDTCQELLLKAFRNTNNSAPQLISGTIAVCASVLLRGIHVEHFLDALMQADHYLSQKLSSLGACKAHARDFYRKCFANRSVDMAAVHSPFFVLIVAANMESLFPIKKNEKNQREEAFTRQNGGVKRAEQDHLSSQDAAVVFLNHNSNANAACHWTNSSRYVDSNNNNNNNNENDQEQNNNSNDNDSPRLGPSQPPNTANQVLTQQRRKIDEELCTPLDWTDHMLNSTPNVPQIAEILISSSSYGGGDENSSSSSTILPLNSISMGNIPPGVLQMNNSLFKDETGLLSDQMNAPVDTFVQIFIAGRLASVQLGKPGNVQKCWQNASRAFAMCPEQYASPFAELATISRLKMGDAPVEVNTLRTHLGATILEDVALAIKCGHPPAFDAAVSDASRELAERGLLAAVMTLRSHAVMMLVKKYLNSTDQQSEQSKRADLNEFFNRYRSQLPKTLLESEMELIAPLILGVKLKARLENQTLVMPSDPFAFDH